SSVTCIACHLMKMDDVVHPTECMPQLLEQVRHHKANIDCNDCIVMVTTLVLE
ncbi:hypothetical protein ACJX0J_041821, partial [Zea mays]